MDTHEMKRRASRLRRTLSAKRKDKAMLVEARQHGMTIADRFRRVLGVEAKDYREAMAIVEANEKLISRKNDEIKNAECDLAIALDQLARVETTF